MGQEGRKTPAAPLGDSLPHGVVARGLGPSIWSLASSVHCGHWGDHDLVASSEWETASPSRSLSRPGGAEDTQQGGIFSPVCGEFICLLPPTAPCQEGRGVLLWILAVWLSQPPPTHPIPAFSALPTAACPPQCPDHGRLTSTHCSLVGGLWVQG